MDGRQLAALYTVQHRLARDAKEPHGVNHRNVPFRYGLDEATPDLITAAASALPKELLA
jgi:type VI protein secretion system component Hcp